MILVTAEQIIRYYDECHIDYQMVWRVGRTHSIHYGFYDESARNHEHAVTNMIATLAETAKVRPHERVLDAGCGVGGSAVWLAKNCGADVTGINISPSHIMKAEEFSRKSGENIAFLERDFTDTKLPDATFDVVWFLESGCYADAKEDIVREAGRLLKTGGRLVVADGFLSSGSCSGKDERHMRKWLDGWAIPNLASVQSFTSCLEEAGFTNISYRNITENVMPSSLGMYRAGIITYPIGIVLNFLGLRSDVQTGNLIASIYQHKTLKRNLWEYGIFCAEKPHVQ